MSGLTPPPISSESPKFCLQHYPDVTVSIDVSNEPRDLVADVDVAIRLGPMPDSGVVATRIRTVTRHLCVLATWHGESASELIQIIRDARDLDDPAAAPHL